MEQEPVVKYITITTVANNIFTQRLADANTYLRAQIPSLVSNTYLKYHENLKDCYVKNENRVVVNGIYGTTDTMEGV